MYGYVRRPKRVINPFLTYGYVAMDPFFKARNKTRGPPWGQHETYIEDLYRTFGKSKLPDRDYARFQKAYEFRQRELQDVERMRQELDSERQLRVARDAHLSESVDHIRKLTDALRTVTAQYSKLKSDSDGRSGAEPTNDSDGRGGGVGIQPEAQALPGPVDSTGVQSGVQPNVEGDSSGQGGQHDAEGRHVGGSDPDGGVQLREDTVSKGGAD